jgi:hypothetical protein
MERREGERGELRQRPGGASPFYRAPEGAGLHGWRQCLDLKALVPQSRGGGGVITVH